MGVCDRSTGRCSCRAGFTGEACQRLTCSANCNGRGRCMSIRGAAAVADGQGLIFEGMYGGWDADMIHGCLCDDGWEGYDCSLRCVPVLCTVLAPTSGCLSHAAYTKLSFLSRKRWVIRSLPCESRLAAGCLFENTFVCLKSIGGYHRGVCRIE